MEMKRIFYKFIGICGIILLLLMGMVVILDPFYHFHGPLPFLKAVLEDRDFQVSGTIDHFDYDALVVGTSIIENANLSEVNNLFDCNAIKVVRASGRTSDLCYYVNRAFATNNDIDTVIFAMSFEELLSDLDVQLFECDFYYLFDGNPFNDIKYLLNKDVLLKKIPMQLAYSFIYDYDEAEPYSWYKSKSFSVDSCISMYHPRNSFENMISEDYFTDMLSGNLSMMCEMVENNPQTDFYLYMSPYSALWWDEAYRSGQYYAYMNALNQVYEFLTRYDNVHLYDYILNGDITFDLDSYMDLLHFSPEWNSKLFHAMSQGEGLYEQVSFYEKEQNFYELIRQFSEYDIAQYYGDAVIK